VPMQPQATVHRVNHSLATQRELLPVVHQSRGITRRRNGRHAQIARQWQLTTPSGSPG
jgi:hypothetical protein